MAGESELLALQETLYASRNPTRRWLHSARRAWVEARIADTPATVERALEIGPGSGLYLPRLAAVARGVIAADIEDAYLAHARALAATIPQLQCVRDDIAATRLDAASFDLILCTEVIEHLVDSAPALAGMCRLLKPQGRLILTTPQRYSLLEMCARIAFLPGIISLVRLIYREPVLPTGHINLLTARALRQQLEAAGFTVCAQARMGFYLPLVAEFCGATGQRFLARCEAHLGKTILRGLLWTQCYVLKHREPAA